MKSTKFDQSWASEHTQSSTTGFYPYFASPERKIFGSPPSDVRKVIPAPNNADTSIIHFKRPGVLGGYRAS
ncbi:hypothetical protein HPB50_016818 [Hyalomma asiaticum]|uniref:Uncharacterized protein n=1 Tax=Hyalomma asiaticum TaxID=266040 RepID=A0ACB7TJ93_HYAAI|nr:hypothetical protein HPB50_016818 [Hyalomma asiaticum]